MGAIRPLDMVLAVSADQEGLGRAQSKFERVWWVTHGRDDQSSEHEYLRLSLASGLVLELSRDHLLYVGECCKSEHARPADSVSPGDTVFTVGEGSAPSVSASEVLEVDVVQKKGLYSVFVTGGSMGVVVNGVVASSMTDGLKKHEPMMRLIGVLMGYMFDSFQWLNRLVGQAAVEELEQNERQALEVYERYIDFAFGFIKGDHYPGVMPLFLALYVPFTALVGVLMGLRVVLLTSPALQCSLAVAVVGLAISKRK